MRSKGIILKIFHVAGTSGALHARTNRFIINKRFWCRKRRVLRRRWSDEFIEVVTMLDANGENQLRLVTTELNGRIALLEKKLLEKERGREALQDSEKRYRRLFESAKDGILILDAGTGKVVDVNPYLLKLLGYSYDAFLGQHIWEVGVFKDIAESKEAFKTLQDSEYVRYDDLPLETIDGRPIAVEFVSNVYLVDNSKVIQCNIRDITARKRADAEHKRLMTAIDQVGEVIIMTDAQGGIQFVNPAFERTTGYSREDAIGQNVSILRSSEQDESFYRNLWDTLRGGRVWEGRITNKRKDGALYIDETTITPVRDPSSGMIVNYVAVGRDISEHLRLSAQLQQAQKMEAVGRLAGGVAHDFNNMLSVIIGHANLALIGLDPVQPLHANLDEILKAAERSADLTRQLLAFARKQTIAPKVLDLNETVTGMFKMLKRLIGVAIELNWQPGNDLWTVKMDPSQIDQILTNLCINASDSIAGVGKITIETGNNVVDEGYCAHNPGFVPGEYVRLTVGDNGCGMDKKTLAHIFEPFFTTKAVGMGTGLGLSTVYGAVKQNNGFINVYSEPGLGTTFAIYLPRFMDKSAQAPTDSVTASAQRGQETILLVEDEPSILNVVTMLLTRQGYTVLAANAPDEAIRLAGEHIGEISLLMTDVVMPGMNGRDLAEKLLSLNPRLQCLYMSGYTADIIAHHCVLDGKVHFIQKPFTMTDLAAKVREVLDSK
jgi:PAS domain S-box-containing protein